MLDGIRMIAGSLFLLSGVLTFLMEITGVFRFKYVLNRMHAAAIGDTLGISLSMIGLMIFSGWNNATLKMALVIAFLWCASPVSSHLIARLEVTTNEELGQYCKLQGETASAEGEELSGERVSSEEGEV